MEMLEVRLQRLERQNARLKAVGLLILALMASVFLMGQTRAPGVVEAQKFILVSGDGTPKGELGLSSVGNPHLWLYDRNGQLAASMAIPSAENGAGGVIALGSTLGPESSSRLVIRAYDDNTAPFIQAKNEFKQVIWALP